MVWLALLNINSNILYSWLYTPCLLAIVKLIVVHNSEIISVQELFKVITVITYMHGHEVGISILLGEIHMLFCKYITLCDVPMHVNIV